jgi:anionic cell wall polymer biosynthesis LytR-Cps2A-Psr (LCP) family protein
LLGLPINHYVIINLQGFDDLVNALGGVTVRVKHPVPIGGIKTYGGYKKPSGYIEPGLRHLTGYQALWYARSRSSTNDYVRMGRQRCLMGALLDQADPFTVLRNYPKIAEASESLLHTNLPQSVLPELAHVAGKAASAHISQLGLVPPLVSVTNPDVSLIQAKVRQAIEASKSSAGAPSSKHRGGRSASPGNGPPSASPTPPGGTTKDAVKGHSVTLGATCSYH